MSVLLIYGASLVAVGLVFVRHQLQRREFRRRMGLGPGRRI